MKKTALLVLAISISFGVVEGKKSLAALQESAARNPQNTRVLFALTERYCEEDSSVQAVESWKKLVALDTALADDLFVKAKVATYLGLEPFYPQPVSDSMADSPRLSPDGKWIVFQAVKNGAHNIGMMDFYGENRRWLTNASAKDSTYYMAPSFAGSSDKVFYLLYVSGEGVSNLVQQDLTTSKTQDVFTSSITLLDPVSASPDGSKIMLTHYSPDTKSVELAQYDLKNGKLTELTDNIFSDRYPRYSWDGKYVVYATNNCLRYGISIMDTRGRVVEQITDGSIDDVTPSFGDKDRKIAFASLRQGGDQWDIFVYDRRSKHIIPVTFHERQDYLPDITEDGNWVIFASTRSEDGIPRTFIVSLNQSIPIERLVEKIKEKENPQGESNEEISP